MQEQHEPLHRKVGHGAAHVRDLPGGEVLVPQSVERLLRTHPEPGPPPVQVDIAEIPVPQVHRVREGGALHESGDLVPVVGQQRSHETVDVSGSHQHIDVKAMARAGLAGRGALPEPFVDRAPLEVQDVDTVFVGEQLHIPVRECDQDLPVNLVVLLAVPVGHRGQRKP